MNAQKPQNLKNQLSSLVIQVHLLLDPWPQTPIINARRTPGEHSTGLGPQHLPTPNPDIPNDLVQAYIE